MNARTVPLDRVLPGAILADNVEDAAGHLLLRVGAIVTESSLEALRHGGVESVKVGVAAEHLSEHRAIERLHLESRLQQAFRYAGDNEARRQLWQALLEYKLGDL